MIPRLNISFPLRRQWKYWCGKQYIPQEGEYLLNHARAGIMLALQTSVSAGARVGVVVYNCHTVANAIVSVGCVPVFLDVTDRLTINISSLPSNLAAVVVTNLFGIRNDIAAIRQACPDAVIIVDNAHGYGLPLEGDFMVQSINQGKFPALGEGGIMRINPATPHYDDWRHLLDEHYAALPGYSNFDCLRLFLSMQTKALLYGSLFFLTRYLKRYRAQLADHRIPSILRMAPGVSRLYQDAIMTIDGEIVAQHINASYWQDRLDLQDNVLRVWYGDNAFMLLLECSDVDAERAWFARQGIETATHFRHAIDWAREFGYCPGACPNAERLVEHLLMIPTYKH